MNKIFLCASVGLISFGCFAQSRLSKKQLENISKDQQELYFRVVEKDSLTTLKINNYLATHGESKRVIKEDNVVYVLVDVEDGKPLYKTTDNKNAALATGTNHLQIGGSLGLDLDGSGRIVAVWDGGPVERTHPEFQNSTNTLSRVTNIESLNTEGLPEIDTHGTHVTGTISARGVNANAMGMANNVSIRTYNFLNDKPEMVVALNDQNNKIYISNHSYGLPINQSDGNQLDAWRMGAYTSDAREVDDIARANPKYLMVTSAGNGGTVTYPGGGLASGFDKLTGDKNAKNNLVIANASPTLNINPFTGDVNMTFVINPSSSQGPTDDLRIKPDIAGDGTSVFSTVPNDGYGFLSGTSMSTPNITGSLVLLQQYFELLNDIEMNAATLKALVCHTALDDDLIVGPDPKFGWGLLDAKRAAQVLTDANSGLALVKELTLSNGAVYSRDFSVGPQTGEKLSATICWTDVRGMTATSADENSQKPRLINDLDLRITKDGVTYLPWRLEYSGSSFSNSKSDNFVDNVERIDIEVPEPGIYTLNVSHKGSIQASVPLGALEQDYSLIITGNNLTLGLNDKALARNLMVYPNPSNGEFTISFDFQSNTSEESIKINIYDLSGRLVFKNIYENRYNRFNETINLKNLKTGVYIANISQGLNTTSRKIIID